MYGEASSGPRSQWSRDRGRSGCVAVRPLVAQEPFGLPLWTAFFIELPHPVITRERLRDVLAPRPRDRALGVGPGTGYYSLHVAEWLKPGGTLDVLDIQQAMLDHGPCAVG